MLTSLARVFSTQGVVVPDTRWRSLPPTSVPVAGRSNGGFSQQAYRLQLSQSASGAEDNQAPGRGARVAPPPDAGEQNGVGTGDAGDASESGARGYGTPPSPTGRKLDLQA